MNGRDKIIMTITTASPPSAESSATSPRPGAEARFKVGTQTVPGDPLMSVGQRTIFDPCLRHDSRRVYMSSLHVLSDTESVLGDLLMVLF